MLGLARRIAELLFNEPATRRHAGAAPTRRAAWILAGCFVAGRSKTTAGILPPRAAHPAKIRRSAATRASDLVHWSGQEQSFCRARLCQPLTLTAYCSLLPASALFR